jgi:hypothetical protein
VKRRVSLRWAKVKVVAVTPKKKKIRPRFEPDASYEAGLLTIIFHCSVPLHKEEKNTMH